MSKEEEIDFEKLLAEGMLPPSLYPRGNVTPAELRETRKEVIEEAFQGMDRSTQTVRRLSDRLAFLEWIVLVGGLTLFAQWVLQKP